MKSYTDLEQSKKLAKILPVESADMRYGYIAPYNYSDRMYDGGYDKVPYPKGLFKENPNFSENEYDRELSCWSLAALLNALPSGKVLIHDKGNRGYKCICNNIDTNFHDSPVDACVDMIEKLHKLKML